MVAIASLPASMIHSPAYVCLVMLGHHEGLTTVAADGCDWTDAYFAIANARQILQERILWFAVVIILEHLLHYSRRLN
jgi:hypothetical protein